MSKLLLSVSSGLLLAASWYWHLGFLIFLAWLPLLILEQKTNEEGKTPYAKLKLWALSYLTFFIWNLLVTWWIVYASFGGACMAILANSLLMSWVFMLYSTLRRRFHGLWSHWLLLPLWLAWEHAHSLWDLSWTWLNLGNVFAFHHRWIQWYEFTGSSGGTAWVLMVNLLFFQAMRHTKPIVVFRNAMFKIGLVIVLPILLSYGLMLSRTPLSKISKPLNCVVVQPNVDPYNFKFVMEYKQQFLKAIALAKPKLNAQTHYLVLPETFITNNINEKFLNESEELAWFRDSLIKTRPNLKIITGGNTYEFYEDPSRVTSTARFDKNSGLHYDVYNSAIYIDATSSQVYHKSKLVPGVEKMPFPALFKPLENLALDLGGTVGSLGLQKERTVFKDKTNQTDIAPVICYESVYSDYVSEYVSNGASLIFIVTNDGWWDDTPGYKQHLNYARLRAIENRRQMARSANTGISCFLDEFGNIYQPSRWWQETVIAQKIYPNTELTFFSRFGDLISYSALLFSSLLLLFYLFRRFFSKAGN